MDVSEKNRMKIVCCASVTAGETLFSTLGNVRIIPDAMLTAADLHDTDALIVRSQRKIDTTLLANTSVKFVATATAGYDHLDIAWLNQHGIAWRDAAGCNANSVAEYIVSALLYLHHHCDVTLTGKTVGIIGVGAVGSHVVHKAKALGLSLLLHDPYVARTAPAGTYVSLKELLTHADMISLHVPLTTSGEFPTYHLVNADFFNQLTKPIVLLNTSRGDVVDTAALLAAQRAGKVTHTVLDVWPHEPVIDAELLRHATIATPHIAGHSVIGKLRGSWQAYVACCAYFNRQITARNPLLDIADLPLAAMDVSDDVLENTWQMVKQIYDIERDSDALKAALPCDADELRVHFQQLRKNYALRYEFPCYDVTAEYRTQLAATTRGSALLERLLSLDIGCHKTPPP